jgi:hypothetical protein
MDEAGADGSNALPGRVLPAGPICHPVRPFLTANSSARSDPIRSKPGARGFSPLSYPSPS